MFKTFIVDVPKIFKRIFSVDSPHIKAHANGRNIVGQQHPTLLGPTCCVRLHGTTTMLALVAYSLKSVKLLGPCKRTQHCWPKNPNNTQQCCDSLRPFAWAFRRSHTKESVTSIQLIKYSSSTFR